MSIQALIDDAEARGVRYPVLVAREELKALNAEIERLSILVVTHEGNFMCLRARAEKAERGRAAALSALLELADIVDGSRAGETQVDSFTTQPARKLLLLASKES